MAATTIYQYVVNIPPAYAQLLMATFCLTRLCHLDARKQDYSAVAFNFFIGFCFFGSICYSLAFQWLSTHPNIKTPNKYVTWFLYTAIVFAFAHHFAPFFGPIVANLLYILATTGSSFFLFNLHLIKCNVVDCC